ncbi:MAG: septum site-determining protein MinC [Desertifilum sp.]|nr:septum site-determining protein MinC [Desertifilum sp.]
MSDSAAPSPVPILGPQPADVSEHGSGGEERHLQVRLKSEGGHLLLSLPPDAEFGGTWTELAQQLQLRLTGGERFWQPNTTVHLMARDRLLDLRQLQAIADALNEVQLKLKRVYTSRRQTAVAAATAGYSVEQISAVTHLSQAEANTSQPLAEPLYLQATLRSGVEIRHPGSVVIVGDLNPGSAIVAQGDILVWGRLRGVAHAGAGGNAQCIIMALQMEPTQLRIAEHLARAPQTPPNQYQPEVAYATSEGIRITKAMDFAKLRPAQLMSDSLGANSEVLKNVKIRPNGLMLPKTDNELPTTDNE